MAQIILAGDTVVINSTLRLKDIKDIAKYYPRDLTIYEDSVAKFAVMPTEGEGSINRYGISFGKESRDGSGRASVTVKCRAAADEDPADWIADNLGIAISNLEEIEERVPEKIREMRANRDNMAQRVTVV